MVRPKFRGHGYAKNLINQTKDQIEVPLIECITETPEICNLLEVTGFTMKIHNPTSGYYYYLYHQERLS